MTLISAASGVLSLLRGMEVNGCLVGGVAVSVRCNPRFTHDVDLAVAIENDKRAEQIISALTGNGYSISAVVEQEAVGRLAMVRITNGEGINVDLLMASSGIEAEIVVAAERIEVVSGFLLPVAQIGHLVALKLLSVAPGRETDIADLRSLAAIAGAQDWDLTTLAVTMIIDRGYSRGRNLVADLQALRSAIITIENVEY